MKTPLLTGAFFISILFAFGIHANAQFSNDSAITYFVCNAPGTQETVSAFSDGNGGTYSFWIDERNGSAGTAIYGQHLDSLGNAQWTVNGKSFYQGDSVEIWNMKAIAWQSGILICWYQGHFGVGGDTLLCNYYNTDGVSQWAHPTLAANTNSNILYIGTDNLDVYPNDSGATITFEIAKYGGSNYFSFNRIDFSGNLHWPIDTFAYTCNGDYYDVGDDHHGGFYVAASTGGLGTDIYMSHFNLQGQLTIPTPVDISTGQGGRDEGRWKVLVGSDTAAYIVWPSGGANDNISIAKIRPDGTLPWDSAKSICSAPGYQDYSDAIIVGDTIYAVWMDGRPGAVSYDIYMQSLDTAGNGLWTPNGILICHLASYLPYAKLSTSGNNIVATYEMDDGYRAQQVRPDSTTVWPANGININVNNPPFYGDYALVSAADGSVTAIWSDISNVDICATRVRPNGILTAVEELKGNSMSLYPNPANGQFSIQLDKGDFESVVISLYNAAGALVLQKKNEDVSGIITISTKDFPAGIYFVKVNSSNYNAYAKVCVIGE